MANLEPEREEMMSEMWGRGRVQIFLGPCK